MSETMYLDPAIRNWVLFPIMLIMILVGILRHYVSQLLTSPPKTSAKAIREAQALNRARLLRSPSASEIPASAFHSRKTYLIQSFSENKYLKNPNATGAPNPMTDPAGMEQMMEGMKKQFSQIIPQTILMSWISFFFSGFVLIKLPFPLTVRFKSMLQSGIMTKDMDAMWVSSLSWYFLNLFGLSGLLSLILGEQTSGLDMQQMQMMGMGAPQQPQDMNKIFKSEKEFLELAVHEYALEDVEDRLLKKYGYKVEGKKDV